MSVVYQVDYVCSDGRVRRGTGPWPSSLEEPGALDEFARRLARHEGVDSVSIAEWRALGEVTMVTVEGGEPDA